MWANYRGIVLKQGPPCHLLPFLLTHVVLCVNRHHITSTASQTVHTCYAVHFACTITHFHLHYTLTCTGITTWPGLFRACSPLLALTWTKSTKLSITCLLQLVLEDSHQTCVRTHPKGRSLSGNALTGLGAALHGFNGLCCTSVSYQCALSQSCFIAVEIFPVWIDNVSEYMQHVLYGDFFYFV